MDYYSDEQNIFDNSQIFSISNLQIYRIYVIRMSSYGIIMESSITKRFYLATAMMVSGKYKAFSGLRSYIFDLITLCCPVAV